MSTKENFASKVVLVTGGAQGVGRGISQSFLDDGAHVVVCGRKTPASLPQSADGRNAQFITCDVTDTDATQAMLTAIVAEHGRLDVLVNAGGTPFAYAADGSPRFHQSILRLNLVAPLTLAIQANAIMQKQAEGGVVEFIGSIAATRPQPGTATYAAAKAGILSLTSSLAIEWAPQVRVGAVSPGLVETEQSELHYGDAAGVAAVAASIPAQRMAQPSDIGDACVFMASARASYVTGTSLLVHGGGEKPGFLNVANVNKN